MKKVVVPDGMLQASRSVRNLERLHPDFVELILVAALTWLMENPIVPTEESIVAEAKATREVEATMHVQWIAWWQRRMFLAPEPVVPDAVKDLLTSDRLDTTVNTLILEAFRRGQKVGAQ